MAKTSPKITDGQEKVSFWIEHSLGISQWSVVEEEVSHLLASQFTPRSDQVAIRRGFFAIEQFRSKLSFADELLTTRLKDSEHRTWSGLNTDLGKRSADRNKLAHWPEQHFPQAPAGKRVALVKHRLFSKGVQAPNMLRELNLLSKGHPPFDALCARDLNQMRLGFFALTVRIHRLRHKLLNLKQIFPVEAEKPIKTLSLQKMIENAAYFMGTNSTWVL